MGSRPNRLGIRVFTNSMMRDTAVSGVVRLHEIEVALGSRRAEIGDRALIYSMGAGDDAALCCLPEDFSETHHRHRTG